MFSEVIRTIEALPSPLIIAVSGGIDSMVLLHLAIQAKSPKELMIVHIDHMIRQESSEDAKFVQSYSRSQGIACDT